MEADGRGRARAVPAAAGRSSGSVAEAGMGKPALPHRKQLISRGQAAGSGQLPQEQRQRAAQAAFGGAGAAAAKPALARQEQAGGDLVVDIRL